MCRRLLLLLKLSDPVIKLAFTLHMLFLISQLSQFLLQHLLLHLQHILLLGTKSCICLFLPAKILPFAL